MRPDHFLARLQGVVKLHRLHMMSADKVVATGACILVVNQPTAYCCSAHTAGWHGILDTLTRGL